jgi:hypothetical protein
MLPYCRKETLCDQTDKDVRDVYMIEILNNRLQLAENSFWPDCLQTSPVLLFSVSCHTWMNVYCIFLWWKDCYCNCTRFVKNIKIKEGKSSNKSWCSIVIIVILVTLSVMNAIFNFIIVLCSLTCINQVKQSPLPYPVIFWWNRKELHRAISGEKGGHLTCRIPCLTNHRDTSAPVGKNVGW